MSSEKNKLVTRFLKTKDPQLRDQIILSFQPLVEYVAWKLAFNKSDIEDLVQVGTIGLIKSLERFDPDKEIDFSTFATPNIIGEIKHYFRDKSSIIKIPRRLQEQNSRIKTFVKGYMQDNAKSPTIQTIANELGITDEEVLESMEAGQSSYVSSLDAPAFAENDRSDGDAPTLIESLSATTDDDQLLVQESLQLAIQQLPDREQRIILLRFYEGKTQAEIADHLNLSQMHISRLIGSAVARLKKVLEGTR